MKIKYLLYFIAFLGISCSTPKTVHLHGSITNADAEFITFAIPDTTYLITIDSAGRFDQAVNFDEASYVSMSFGGRFYSLYLEPGFDLSIRFDADDIINTIRFEGVGAVPNTYMSLVRKETSKFPTDNELMMFEEEDFLSKVDSITQILKDLLLLNQSQLSDQFYETELAKIEYGKAEMLVRYPSYHGYLVEEPNFRVSENYWTQLKNVPVNQPQFVGLYQFDNFVYGMIDQQVSELSHKNVSEAFDQSFKVTNTLVEDSTVRAMCYTRNFYQYLTSGITHSQAKQFFEQYGNHLDPSAKELFMETIQRLEKLNPGQLAPNFQFVSMYGDSVSSAQLLGENLLVTVWSSSSQESLDEMDGILDWHQKYGDQIQFVFIAVDDYLDEWRHLVRGMDLPDIQLITNSGWSDPYLYQCVIERLPRLMLIDQNGQFINALLPPPSQNGELEIIKLIEETNL